MNRLQTILANKHTTGAGILYLVAKFGCRIAQAWAPHYHDQIATTADALEGAAVAWGLVMAGDAKPTPPATKP